MDWACSNFCGKNLQKILSENWRLTEYRSSHNCICLTIILNNELTGASFNINPLSRVPIPKQPFNQDWHWNEILSWALINLHTHN
jgi:hypothetical protein